MTILIHPSCMTVSSSTLPRSIPLRLVPTQVLQRSERRRLYYSLQPLICWPNQSQCLPSSGSSLVSLQSYDTLGTNIPLEQLMGEHYMSAPGTRAPQLSIT